MGKEASTTTRLGTIGRYKHGTLPPLRECINVGGLNSSPTLVHLVRQSRRILTASLFTEIPRLRRALFATDANSKPVCSTIPLQSHRERVETVFSRLSSRWFPPSCFGISSHLPSWRDCICGAFDSSSKCQIYTIDHVPKDGLISFPEEAAGMISLSSSEVGLWCKFNTSLSVLSLKLWT